MTLTIGSKTDLGKDYLKVVSRERKIVQGRDSASIARDHERAGRNLYSCGAILISDRYDNPWDAGECFRQAAYNFNAAQKFDIKDELGDLSEVEELSKDLARVCKREAEGRERISERITI